MYFDIKKNMFVFAMHNDANNCVEPKVEFTLSGALSIYKMGGGL